MKIIEKTSLFHCEGRSDKEYHAEIIEVSGGYIVNFRFRRRGAALTSGSKTSTPVDVVQAKKVYDQLVKQKIAKGYTPDLSGTAYQGTEHVGRQSGFLPQLLNVVTEKVAMHLIADDRWAAQ